MRDRLTTCMQKGFLLMCLLMLFTASLHAKELKIKNIVLVHGAFTDGSSWSAVISILQSKGYHVTAVQNPLTSLIQKLAHLNRSLTAILLKTK